MPWIKLFDGVDEIYIWCDELPPPGETGPLVIGACRRSPAGEVPQHLSFNCLRNPPDPPAPEMTFQLQGPIEPTDQLIFVHNGGFPWISFRES